MIEVESWTQGSRTQKISEVKAKDRTSRDQGQEPRAHAQVFSQKKGLQNFFSGDLKNEKVFKKFFRRKRSSNFFFQVISTWGKQEKIFANFPRGFWRFPTKFQRFKKLCCPRAEDRAIFEDLRLRGQGQGHQNVSSRPRTSSRTPPLQNEVKIFCWSSHYFCGKISCALPLYHYIIPPFIRSVAIGARRGGAVASPLACQPKWRIRKIPRF